MIPPSTRDGGLSHRDDHPSAKMIPSSRSEDPSVRQRRPPVSHDDRDLRDGHAEISPNNTPSAFPSATHTHEISLVPRLESFFNKVRNNLRARPIGHHKAELERHHGQRCPLSRDDALEKGGSENEYE